MTTPSQQWWLEPDVFAALGPTQRVRVSDCMYLGSWAGKAKAPGDELTINARGISYGYRAFDPKFTIPWEQVTSLAIEGPGRETRPPLNPRRLLREWSGSGHSNLTWLEGAAGRRSGPR